MIVFPNIKINLGLHVLRRRADGYHDIETAMLPVSWTDILEIVPADTNHKERRTIRSGDFLSPKVRSGDSLTTTGIKIDCPFEKNLVIKALRALRSFGYNVPYVDIFLHKNVPDGAGLGGGSSDAAFTLKCLESLFNLNIDDSTLAKIAATIGCDCPFFIYNKPMLAQGRGDILTPIDGLTEKLADYEILIIKPEGVSVPTAAAYAGITPKIPELPITDILSLPLSEWKLLLKNDFEDSVGKLYPSVLQIKQTLYDYGAVYAAMSGSGSAVFGIFKKDTNHTDLIKTITNGDNTGRRILFAEK